MKYTLLAIRPKYVEEIKAGIKKYEFRKKIPDFSSEEISKTVIVYCSKPVKAIVGEFKVEKVLSMTFSDLMKEISATESYCKRIKNYFGEIEKCNALKISEYVEYVNPVSLEELRALYQGFTAPQNYRYLDKNIKEILCQIDLH